jgi:hypothetical protein
VLSIFGLKPTFLVGRNRPANRFQTQFLIWNHPDIHYAA